MPLTNSSDSNWLRAGGHSVDAPARQSHLSDRIVICLLRIIKFGIRLLQISVSRLTVSSSNSFLLLGLAQCIRRLLRPYTSLSRFVFRIAIYGSSILQISYVVFRQVGVSCLVMYFFRV